MSDIAAERDAFIKTFSVSRETAIKFDSYAAMLADWQSRMNLVAPSTLPHVWSRHFFDSAQLLAHIPGDARTLVDIGSGAGFPGMVLALLGARGVHLVESIQKKAGFLRAVAEGLNIPVTIRAERSEDIKDLRADVVTARAVAPLADLLPVCRHFGKSDGLFLLLKGEKAAEELTKAGQHWHFDVRTIPSRTPEGESLSNGRILLLKNLRHKREASHDSNRYRKRR